MINTNSDTVTAVSQHLIHVLGKEKHACANKLTGH